MKVLYVTTTEDPADANALAGRVLPNADLEVRRVVGVGQVIAALLEGKAYAATLLSRTAAATLESLLSERDHLIETQGFDRALRDRDREQLATLARELAEERERRVVLERTLRHTEDQASSQLAAAADRLHQVAHDTQGLHTRLELDLAERLADRDRLTENTLVGHAVFSREGRLLRCNQKFAAMLGYASVNDALQAGSDEPFRGTPDHGQLVELLDQKGPAESIESSVRRKDGRAVRVLTSAAFAPSAGEEDALVERLFVDVSSRTAVEMELRLARRLETAGRLAAEMASEIERALGAESTEQAQLLVRQLLAFSRHQARPAGFLSLNEAIGRAQSVLRQIAGHAIDLELQLGDIEPVAAGEDDIEQLLMEFISSAAGSLPYGGRLVVTTAAEIDTNFVLRTTLTATAAGYGVQSVQPSSSLARLVARCGGSVQVSGTAGRTSTLQVTLPC